MPTCRATWSAITPQTSGTVVSIDADDGMKVEAGQVLVQLDAERRAGRL